VFEEGFSSAGRPERLYQDLAFHHLYRKRLRSIWDSGHPEERRQLHPEPCFRRLRLDSNEFRKSLQQLIGNLVV
jgi:hypothetical protein